MDKFWVLLVAIMLIALAAPLVVEHVLNFSTGKPAKG